MAIRADGRRGVVATTRFGVEEDCCYHSFHIAANARAVIFENRGDSLNVCRAWIAGYEMLNELARKEGRQIRMVEDVVERAVEILFSRLPRRKQASRCRIRILKQLLRGGVVVGIDRDHWTRPK